jgi:hypothetical protein
MVICLHCALYGRVVPLRVEVWFVQHGHREDVTRYWACPTCARTGHRVVD